MAKQIREIRGLDPDWAEVCLKLEEALRKLRDASEGQLGLVTREPGVARSIRVAIPEKAIPGLEGVAGRAW